ncbi:hypothetical protein BH10PSE14_BH10PSE14_35220 [soil metagenome]
MQNRTDAHAIQLDFNEAIRILMLALEIDPAARSAVQARVRQLQRMGLSKRPEGRAYERFTYGLLELATLATAFRLMAAFVLPIVAVRLLTERWADFVPALVSGVADADVEYEWGAGETDQGPLIAIEGVSLSRLGQKTATDSRYDGPLGRIDRHAGNAMMDDVFGATMVGGVVIDTRSYMVGLAGNLAALDFVSTAQIADEIDRLRFSVL